MSKLNPCAPGARLSPSGDYLAEVAARPRRTGWAPLALAACLLVASPLGWAQAAQPAGAAPAAVASAPALRPDAAKALAAAQEQLRAGNYQAALPLLASAEALPGQSPYEQYIIRRLKAVALFGAGDAVQALATFEQVLDDPMLPPVDRVFILESTVKVALQAKDYPRAAKWMKTYLAAGGQDAELRRLHPQLLSLTGDHAGAAAGAAAQVAAEEAAGRPVPESLLRLLASSQGQAGDDAAYLATLQKLAVTTGKADYWSELIARTARRDGFAGERLRLDLYRLRQAVGTPLSAGEVGDMAYRANQAGLPAEAQKLLDDGFNSQLLGKDSNAAADRQLREQATKAATQDRAGLAEAEASLRTAKDGNSAFGLGFALSGAGLHDKALALMAQGQAKGGLRRPHDAQLHLGIAQWRAGKADDALKTWANVGGSDGTAELARLWTAFVQGQARK